MNTNAANCDIFIQMNKSNTVSIKKIPVAHEPESGFDETKTYTPVRATNLKEFSWHFISEYMWNIFEHFFRNIRSVSKLSLYILSQKQPHENHTHFFCIQILAIMSMQPFVLTADFVSRVGQHVVYEFYFRSLIKHYILFCVDNSIEFFNGVCKKYIFV